MCQSRLICKSYRCLSKSAFLLLTPPAPKRHPGVPCEADRCWLAAAARCSVKLLRQRELHYVRSGDSFTRMSPQRHPSATPASPRRHQSATVCAPHCPTGATIAAAAGAARCAIRCAQVSCGWRALLHIGAHRGTSGHIEAHRRRLRTQTCTYSGCGYSQRLCRRPVRVARALPHSGPGPLAWPPHRLALFWRCRERALQGADPPRLRGACEQQALG